ncbi:uncharacterized protein LOC131326953 [Rhododendron vialii]|uniref:uncharacterized protein LOC131326953 n=1 Tax=Rhododendron vialii TaxID=182163 RepID=UPI00265DC85E|nr:uncharacterized protein LOC131326953 [Rhododendron vialii]
MVLRAPFVRWACIKNSLLTSPRVALFYLQTAAGNKVSCALAIRGPTNRITYTAFGAFLDEYYEILPLGGVVQWRFSSIFSQWLDGLLYHSFLLCNEEGVANAWHLNYVVPVGSAQVCVCLCFTHTFLFTESIVFVIKNSHFGFRNYQKAFVLTFLANGASTWIVLRHEFRAWPVEVIDFKFRKRWGYYDSYVYIVSTKNINFPHKIK